MGKLCLNSVLIGTFNFQLSVIVKLQTLRGFVASSKINTMNTDDIPVTMQGLSEGQ